MNGLLAHIMSLGTWGGTYLLVRLRGRLHCGGSTTSQIRRILTLPLLLLLLLIKLGGAARFSIHLLSLWRMLVLAIISVCKATYVTWRPN